VKFFLIELYKKKYNLSKKPEIVASSNDFVIPEDV
jgi:hypothetical protein